MAMGRMGVVLTGLVPLGHRHGHGRPQGPDMVQVGLKKASIRFRMPQQMLVRSGLTSISSSRREALGVLQEGRAADDIAEGNDVADDGHGQGPDQNICRGQANAHNGEVLPHPLQAGRRGLNQKLVMPAMSGMSSSPMTMPMTPATMTAGTNPALLITPITLFLLWNFTLPKPVGKQQEQAQGHTDGPGDGVGKEAAAAVCHRRKPIGSATGGKARSY